MTNNDLTSQSFDFPDYDSSVGVTEEHGRFMVQNAPPRVLAEFRHPQTDQNGMNMSYQLVQKVLDAMTDSQAQAYLDAEDNEERQRIFDAVYLFNFGAERSLSLYEAAYQRGEGDIELDEYGKFMSAYSSGSLLQLANGDDKLRQRGVEQFEQAISVSPPPWDDVDPSVEQSKWSYDPSVVGSPSMVINEKQMAFATSYAPPSIMNGLKNASDRRVQSDYYRQMEAVYAAMDEDERIQMLMGDSQDRQRAFNNRRFQSFAPQSLVDEYEKADQQGKQRIMQRFDDFANSMKPREMVQYLEDSAIEHEGAYQKFRTTQLGQQRKNQIKRRMQMDNLGVLEEVDEDFDDIDSEIGDEEEIVKPRQIDEPEPLTIDDLQEQSDERVMNLFEDALDQRARRLYERIPKKEEAWIGSQKANEYAEDKLREFDGELTKAKKISNNDWHKMLAAKLRVDNHFQGKWAEKTNPSEFADLEGDELDDYINSAADRMMKAVPWKKGQDAPFQGQMKLYSRELIRQQVLAHQRQEMDDMYDENPHKMKVNRPKGDVEKGIVKRVNSQLVDGMKDRYQDKLDEHEMEKYQKDLLAQKQKEDKEEEKLRRELLKEAGYDPHDFDFRQDGSDIDI